MQPRLPSSMGQTIVASAETKAQQTFKLKVYNGLSTSITQGNFDLIENPHNKNQLLVVASFGGCFLFDCKTDSYNKIVDFKESSKKDKKNSWKSLYQMSHAAIIQSNGTENVDQILIVSKWNFKDDHETDNPFGLRVFRFYWNKNNLNKTLSSIKQKLRFPSALAEKNSLSHLSEHGLYFQACGINKFVIISGGAGTDKQLSICYPMGIFNGSKQLLRNTNQSYIAHGLVCLSLRIRNNMETGIRNIAIAPNCNQTDVDIEESHRVKTLLFFGGSKLAFFESFSMIYFKIRRQQVKKQINLSKNDTKQTENKNEHKDWYESSITTASDDFVDKLMNLTSLKAKKNCKFFAKSSYSRFSYHLIENRYLLIIGGRITNLSNRDRSVLDTILIYDFVSKTWKLSKQFKLPQPLYGHCSILTHNGKYIHIMGRIHMHRNKPLGPKNINWKIQIHTGSWVIERLIWIGYYKEIKDKDKKVKRQFGNMITQENQVNDCTQQPCLLHRLPKDIIVFILHTLLSNLGKYFFERQFH